MACEAQLEDFIRAANLALARKRLAGESDPALRGVLLDLIKALEAGEAIPAKALDDRLKTG